MSDIIKIKLVYSDPCMFFLFSFHMLSLYLNNDGQGFHVSDNPKAAQI